MAIELNGYVKWPIEGGWAFGKVLNIDENKTKVTLPSGQVAEVETASLQSINKEDYSQAVIELANELMKQSGVDIMTIQEAEARIAELEKELSEAKTKVEDMGKQADEVKTLRATDKEDMEKKIEEAEAERDEATAKYNEASAELEAIKKERIGEARFSEIGEEAAFAALKIEDVAEAKAKLSEMTEAAFDVVKNLAEAFPKLTDQTQTALVLV